MSAPASPSTHTVGLHSADTPSTLLSVLWLRKPSACLPPVTSCQAQDSMPKALCRLSCRLSWWHSGHLSTVSWGGTSLAPQQPCWPASASCGGRTCEHNSVLPSIQHVCRSAQPTDGCGRTHSMLHRICCWVVVMASQTRTTSDT